MTNCGTPSYPTNPIWVEDINTVSANSTLHFNAQSEATTSSFWIDGKLIELRIMALRPNPSGVKNTEQTFAIDGDYAAIPNFRLTTDDTGDGETEINGSNDCAFETGPHPYVMKPFSVDRPASYTFRTISAASEEPGGMNAPAAFDMGLIIYSSFSPTSPEANVVGCRIGYLDGNASVYDRIPLGEDLSRSLTQVTVQLNPGQYYLIMAPRRYQEDYDWVSGTQTNVIEAWGPSGSIRFGDQLANTGGSSTVAWIGFAFLLVGGSLLALNRRKLHV
jgi:LPXTG-motif cell wall-anchored protein